MDYIEISGKNIDDAITEACQKLEVTSDRLDYEVIEKGSSGFLGFGNKPAVIKARIKQDKPEAAPEKKPVEKPVDKPVERTVEKSADTQDKEISKEERSEDNTEKKSSSESRKTGKMNDPKEFLSKVFDAMGLKVDINVEQTEEEIDIELSGDEMGILIGKRGQTLDSLQYLTSLYVNKDQNEYIRVKLDTENYRERRKDTLENLAKNLAYKVKRTKKPVVLEPMNPYERRIIHSCLQNDKYVSTHSEGEEPFRKVVITYNR